MPQTFFLGAIELLNSGLLLVDENILLQVGNGAAVGKHSAAVGQRSLHGIIGRGLLRQNLEDQAWIGDPVITSLVEEGCPPATTKTSG